MEKKVYFAGSIRGGREDAAVYKRIIDYINRTDTVLTEHIGLGCLSVKSANKRG
jgi:putative deoxyribonucleoside 5'-monophosphate N-glycosidase